MSDTGACRRFDAFCKTVLRREMWNHLREEARRRKRETTFCALAPGGIDLFGVRDTYPSDQAVFSAFGYTLAIQDERLALGLAGLSRGEQQILILYSVLALQDGEIGRFVGMSRSTVQRHRTKTLQELRYILACDGGKNHGTTDF